MPMNVDEEEPSAKKRKRFDPTRCPHHQTNVRKIPKVASLAPNYALGHPPSSIVAHKLGQAKLAMGFDIETHDLVERGGGGTGRFGHPWRSKSSIFHLRIVQLGWAMGGSSQEESITERAERLVKPDGFEISKLAIKKHGITNEQARDEGIPLSQALEEFMCAAWSIHELQSTVVSHHIEFDAGVIDEELHRCSMDHWRSSWRTIATRGVCTMDPDIQEWLQRAFGKEKGIGEKMLVMNLRDSIRLFYNSSPRICDLMQKSHTAGADAEMHLLLYRALRDLALRSGSHAHAGLT